jgi:acyl phosphate:glycerol-3-phosphate acyltransferase
MDYLIIGVLSYLLGSIPFGYIFTKFFLKKDIRDVGSGNIGATNALRSGNKLIGYLTLVFDIGKAVIPVLFVKINYPDLIFLSSLCAFLGHVFPLWLKFKGGKGVATYLGILFVINISYGIIFITIWLFIYFLSKYSSLSSILATLSIPIFLLISKNFSEVSFFVIMFVLIFL